MNTETLIMLSPIAVVLVVGLLLLWAHRRKRIREDREWAEQLRRERERLERVRAEMEERQRRSRDAGPTSGPSASRRPAYPLEGRGGIVNRSTFSGKNDPVEEERARRRRQDDDWATDPMNPLNAASPLSPLNPLNPSGIYADHSTPAPDCSPRHDPSPSYHDHSPSYSSDPSPSYGSDSGGSSCSPSSGD